jgi:hypothetical protein
VATHTHIYASKYIHRTWLWEKEQRVSAARHFTVDAYQA